MLFNLRMQGQFDILLFSTLNKGELPPVRLQISTNNEPLSAATFEQRVHALRQLHATIFLVQAGRSNELARMQANDLEALLQENDRLFVTAAGEGSFWLTMTTMTRAAFKSLSCIALLYDEGRQALLERVRATTELKKLEVKQKEIDMGFQHAKGVIDLFQKIDKIKNPQTREAVIRALSSNAAAFGKQSLPLLEYVDAKLDRPADKKG